MKRFVRSYRSGELFRKMVLTGSYGYADGVPKDVEMVCGQIAAQMLCDMVARNVLPDAIKQMTQGGVGEGGRTIFASTHAPLPRYLEDILENYRALWVDVA